MKPLFVNAVGLWSPTYPSASAWASRQADPAAATPKATLLPPLIRRRASLLTRAGAEAFAQAARGGGADLASVCSVWTSAYGEIATTVDLLEQMRSEPEGLPWPTRFHASVHNAAAGFLSIACGNRSFSTSLAGGPKGVAFGLLETVALLEERGGEAILVALDEPPPVPFSPKVAFPTLAVAFHLSQEKREQSLLRVTEVRPGSLAARVPEPFASHPCGAALLLAEAALARSPQEVPLSLTGEGDWIAVLDAA